MSIFQYSNLVRFFFVPDSGRNTGIIIVLGAWVERSLKHRGWTHDKLIYIRSMTGDEKQLVDNSMRHQAFRYETLDDLLLDEQSILDNTEFEREKRILISEISRRTKG